MLVDVRYTVECDEGRCWLTFSMLSSVLGVGVGSFQPARDHSLSRHESSLSVLLLRAPRVVLVRCTLHRPVCLAARHNVVR